MKIDQPELDNKLSRDMALTLKHGDYVYYGGQRWKVNGKPVIRKRANTFKIPVKHGLYSYGYITESNCHEFTTVKVTQ